MMKELQEADRVIKLSHQTADRDGVNRNGRSGFLGSWTRVEKKWDHDLFEEANKSPARANEDEQVAKVEALLAS